MVDSDQDRSYNNRKFQTSDGDRAAASKAAELQKSHDTPDLSKVQGSSNGTGLERKMDSPPYDAQDLLKRSSRVRLR
jgi:hypothetical protein